MARLDELATMKVEIMSRIVADQEICKALHYNHPDFLEQPDIKNPYSLIYDNVFPYRVIPDLADEAKTYINLSFDKWKYVNNSFKSGDIVVYIISHVDIMKTDYGSCRVDYIANKVDSLLNQTRGLGLGKLQFSSMGESIINNKFLGLYLVYRPVEFN